MNKYYIQDDIKKSLRVLQAKMQKINPSRAEEIESLIRGQLDLPQWAMTMRVDLWESIVRKSEAIQAELRVNNKKNLKRLKSLEEKQPALIDQVSELAASATGDEELAKLAQTAKGLLKKSCPLVVDAKKSLRAELGREGSLDSIDQDAYTKRKKRSGQVRSLHSEAELALTQLNEQTAALDEKIAALSSELERADRTNKDNN